MGVTSKVKEIVFPCIMRNIKCGHVVLFSADKIGTVVSEDNSGNIRVGYHCDYWVSATNENTWEPSLPVTLSNS